MRKFAWFVACLWLLILGLFAVGCGHDKGPTAPSDDRAASTPPEDLTKEVVVAIEKFPSGLTVNLYGNVQLGLDTPTDPVGGQIRLRVYADDGKLTTVVADWANSAPIGGTNDTFFGEGTLPTLNISKIDMALILQTRQSLCPGGTISTGCWHFFTFPNRAVTRLLPAGQYRLNTVACPAGLYCGPSNNEVRIQGPMPAINQGRSVGRRVMDVNGVQLPKVPLSNWRIVPNDF